ncbi:MAG: glycosyl hydrolase [Dactylosporangium sp.]|nr:glycosyl hydrolase 115 family protein [Dactylosporangium sp.]NNJ61612.1 glycosyl hydrolase [Dactylosporangium sp.]
MSRRPSRADTPDDATPYPPDHTRSHPPDHTSRYVVTAWQSGAFALVAGGKATPLRVSEGDWPGVVRAVRDLRGDLARVTGAEPTVAMAAVPDLEARAHPEVVLIGTINRSPLIDSLIAEGKLDVTGVAGEWETSLEQIVEDPLPGIARALVLAGSDQRGTIFAVYDVCRQLGVSPWYWWLDISPRHQDEVYVLPGRHTQGTPAVKYRGFFINDENPVLGTWAPGHFGPGLAPGFPNGFNAAFYARVFETILRLKANYLWPAVWGRAFAEDDPTNHATAKDYGVIMGTSHEAPMMRGIEEWNRHAVPAVRDAGGTIVVPGHDPYGGTGEWSFRHNAEAIKAYWTEGIRRMTAEDFEGVVTLGMRGNGDLCLSDGDGIELMRDIIATQREILTREIGRDVTKLPQAWALYKEVQRYADQGLSAPDDVTLILSDDNWGNLRKLPDPDLPRRAGGWGLYYHFDYVGDGRNYKWVDTTLLANAWDQLHQAYRYGVDRLWVVNVGDLKGQELPLSFFLDYAWDPDRWPVERLPEWERRFAEQQFGPEPAANIADVLHTYGRLQSRRKPELLNRRISLDESKDLTTDATAVVYDDQASPFSLTDYQEIEQVTEEWRCLARRVERLGQSLPPRCQDTYYHLVRYPVEATANLYALRLAQFTNLHYARQGRAATNDLAAVAEARLADDQRMSEYYNTVLAGGKWRGFQTQPKIGYGDVERYGPDASWQQPELDNVAITDEIFPPVRRIAVPPVEAMGVAIDGSEACWPGGRTAPVLPAFSPFQRQPRQYIEVFNRGQKAFHVDVVPGVPWVIADPPTIRVEQQVRVALRIDWARVPSGTTTVPITIAGSEGTTVVVAAVVERPEAPAAGFCGFVEANGYVAVEAEHASTIVDTPDVRWRRIPDIGRTGAGMEPFPVTARPVRPGADGPRLEYELTLLTAGTVTVWGYLSPRNDTRSSGGPRYAVSFDDDAPQTVAIAARTGAEDLTMNRQWERNTSDNINRTATVHQIGSPGVHRLKFWMVDPTVVVQRIIVDTGGLRPSCLGPPESHHVEGNLG